MSNEGEIRKLKRRYSAQLLQHPGICGVGVEKDDTGTFHLAVHVNSDDPAVQQQIPRQIEGHVVKLVRSGPFEKQ